VKISHLIKTTWLPLAAIYMMSVPNAGACPAAGNAAKFNASKLLRAHGLISAIGAARTEPLLMATVLRTEANSDSNSKLDVTGMWEVTQKIGGDIFDHAFEQFYADGNEMQNSAVVPPNLGNICFGVWVRTGNREFKLKHYGWNFDAQGNFTGTFFLSALITLVDADNYTGTFVTETLLLSGVPDPNLHGEGIIIARRIKLDK
jgi:hypothetical protein